MNQLFQIKKGLTEWFSPCPHASPSHYEGTTPL